MRVDPGGQVGMAALELRVHGVSGTPPESLLDRPLVHRVAGDNIAGFYAPRLVAERTDAAPNPQAPQQIPAPQLVGYSWGGLTSGSPGRALWLLLLPFTLVNIAPRARPETAAATGTGRWSRVWWIWYLSRLLALTLTLLFTLAGVGVGEDLIGWQCSGTDVCTNSLPHWITGRSVGRTLLVGSVVPMAMLTLLWFVSSRTANRYERTRAHLGGYRTRTEPEHHRDTNALEVGLGSTLMWMNAAPVRRLRAVHMQCGFAAVLFSVVAPTDWWWLGFAPAGIVVYAVVALGLSSFTGHGTSRKWPRASMLVWGALALFGTVAVVGLAAGWTDIRSRYAEVGPGHRRAGLPFFDLFVLVDSAAAVGVLLALIAAVALTRGGRRVANRAGDHAELAPGLFGLAAGGLAALGLFLAAAFTSGIYLYAATVLHNGGPKPSFREISTIYQFVRVPNTVAVATLAYAYAVLALLAVVVVVGAPVARRLWNCPRTREQLQADYPRPSPPGPDDEKRSRQIHRAMFFGALVDRLPWLVGPLVGVGLLIVLGWGTWLGLHTSAPAAADSVFGTGQGLWSRNWQSGLGAYLVVATVLLLVSLGTIAFRVPATRRSVGILWDVASFWPRTCHPLAAPCYAERTVPDLVTYITNRRMTHGDGVIVLAGHSQGSVISAATILQLRTYDREPMRDPKAGDLAVTVVPRLAFLSFGCVLRRLYGRYFPVYFGPARLNDLQTILTTEPDIDAPDGATPAPRWINLWRYTDYLGGQVTTGPPQQLAPPVTLGDPTVAPTNPPTQGPLDWEWHAPDPPAFDRNPGDTTYSRAERHSNFWADPSGYFQLAVRELVEQTEADGGAA
ncbi:MAG TPA: hypothetical protein VE081_08755 [Sporichthyaceae bacterium]|nr:hypothetical protein [Sporichthyaceae bacterium]